MIWSVTGQEIASAYDLSGTALSQAYDLHGNELLNEGDYSEWENDYQHTILQARDAWAEEYRANRTIIPVVIHTDQHRYLNAAHKPTFDYLARALKWSEVSAVIGLGDVCGAVYNTGDLNNMTSCLSSLPRAKRIDVAGNHDCQLPRADGSSYAYAPLTDDLFHTLQDSYFDNAGFGGSGGNLRYGYKGLETVIDPLHNIRFCVFAVWATRGDPWYRYYCDSATIEAMISMLSSVDAYDIVILSHIQPYYRETAKHIPPVDGSAGSIGTIYAKTASLGYDVALDQLYADRKERRSGSITDVDGNVHPYDFTACTSDLLCSFSGHSHEDYYVYSADGTVPAVVCDAYRYDNSPMYLVNIDRTKQRINVWKFDEAGNIYNYQVPLTEADT